MRCLNQPVRALVVAAAIAAVLMTAGCGGDKPARSGPPSPATEANATSSRPVAAESPLAVIQTATAPPAAVSVTTPAPAVRQLILVPLQGFPVSVLDRLREYFHDAYGIPVTLGPSVELTTASFNLERQQIIAERLLDLLAADVRRARPDDVIVGLTQYDMMIEDTPQWRFAFALRSEFRDVGVVSMARMDPAVFGEPPDDELFFHRAIKMVAKHLGILYYGLHTSSDPSSVMYGNVLSVGDLDVMGERLPVP